MSLDLTFIGQIVIFLTLIYLMRKYLYGPMTDLMEARSNKIAEGLAAAEAGSEARAKAEEEIAAQLAEARGMAHEILAGAEKRAAELREELVIKSREEAEQIVTSAREEVQAEIQKARQSLRKEVADLAILAAERVIDAELDSKRHAKLIEQTIKGGLN